MAYDMGPYCYNMAQSTTRVPFKLSAILGAVVQVNEHIRMLGMAHMRLNKRSDHQSSVDAGAHPVSEHHEEEAGHRQMSPKGSLRVGCKATPVLPESQKVHVAV